MVREPSPTTHTQHALIHTLNDRHPGKAGRYICDFITKSKDELQNLSADGGSCQRSDCLSSFCSIIHGDVVTMVTHMQTSLWLQRFSQINQKEQKKTRGLVFFWLFSYKLLFLHRLSHMKFVCRRSERR